jgi:hypothetical protein
MRTIVKRRFTEDSLIPDPPNNSRNRASTLKQCGVGGVRALGARNTICALYAVNENRVADAIILTLRSCAGQPKRSRRRRVIVAVFATKCRIIKFAS